MRRATVALAFVISTQLLVACGGGGGGSSATSTPVTTGATFAQPSATSPAPTETPPPSTANDGLASSLNLVFKVELTYPASWVPDFEYAADIGSDGIAEMYRDPRGREYGFFQLNAAGTSNDLDAVAQREASHKLKPYGEHPVIESLTVDGAEARLIRQDASAPGGEPFVEELVVDAPAAGYDFLIVYAHKDYIRQLAESALLLQ